MSGARWTLSSWNAETRGWTEIMEAMPCTSQSQRHQPWFPTGHFQEFQPWASSEPAVIMMPSLPEPAWGVSFPSQQRAPPNNRNVLHTVIMSDIYCIYHHRCQFTFKRLRYKIKRNKRARKEEKTVNVLCPRKLKNVFYKVSLLKL